jgi:ABC-type nickel/cobalt efflux system permease component RcnA
MGLGEGIRKHGFRKWYERELIQSHAHLVLTILCAIGLLSVFEVFSQASRSEKLFDLAALALFAAVGYWSLRRYLFLLTHAEHSANQAVCARCETYGRLAIAEEHPDGRRLVVRCTRCGHQWPMVDGQD